MTPRLLYLSLAVSINFIFCVSAPINEVTKESGQGWYTAVGYQSLYEYSEKEALEKAISAAQEEALKTHSGLKIQSSSTRILAEGNFDISIDNFFQISNFLSEGIITDSKLIKKEIIEYESQRYMKAVINVRVQKIKGEPDPNFKLQATLDRRDYIEGDPINIEVSASKDCYLYIFNVASNDTVYVLLPNQYLNDNFIPKAQAINVPPKDSSISYKTSLLPGKETDQELIKVLAIKGKKMEDFDITLGKRNMALQSFYKMLLDLDRNQITEKDLLFTVKKKPE